MRLIDADTIEEGLGVEDRDLYVQHILDSAPTIEAEPIRHGRWISINGWVECSCCHSEPPNESNIESKYCPNCGARMDGEEK